MDDLDETLDLEQRRKRAMILRRYKSKIERAREISQRRMAPEKNIKKRAYAQARMIFRKKFAGQRGAEYEKLGPTEKMAIDRAIEKKTSAIKKLALRLIPRVKSAEQKRLSSFTQGKSLVNAGAPEGHSRVNEEFEHLLEALASAETGTNQLPDENNAVEPRDAKKAKNSKSSNIKFYNTFGENSAVTEAMTKKSLKSNIDVDTLAEVFDRGMSAWNEDIGVSPQQYAFARVNSFINKGKSYFNEDADLHEAIEKHFYVTFNSTSKGKQLLHKKNKPFTSMADAKDHIDRIAPGHPNRASLGRIHTVDKATGRILRVNNYDTHNTGYPYSPSIGDAKHVKELHESLTENSLWDNIHAKRKRINAGSGERMRKPGSKDAPTAQDFKDAQESVEIDELSTPVLHSYLDKAKKTTPMSRQRKPYGSDPVKHKEDERRREQRNSYMKTAGKKISAKYAAEEVEVFEEKEIPLSHRNKHEVSHYRVLNNGRDVTRHDTYEDAKTYAALHRAKLRKDGYKSNEVTVHAYVKENIDETTGSKYNIPMARSKPKTSTIRTFGSVLDEVDVPVKHLDRARSVWNRTKDIEAVKKFVSSVKEEVEVEESNNTPYVKPHIEKGSTNQSGWKASNKHGRVKYFGMDFKKSAEKHAGISESESILPQKPGVASKKRMSVQNVERDSTPTTPTNDAAHPTSTMSSHNKQAQIKKKILEAKLGNLVNDPKKREIGTDSLVKAYKADTPGEGKDLNESFNIALAAGVGVTLTAADLGMRAQGGFALHPSVIEEMQAREAKIEEERNVTSAARKPLYVKPRRREDGTYTPAKTTMRRTGKKIIKVKDVESPDDDVHDGQ